jgi:hypothetical protein
MAEPIPEPDDLAAVRMARNESIFRETNERTEQEAESEGRGQLVAFVCECARPDCAEVVRLDVTEYEAVRSRPKQFVTAPGHALVAPGVAHVVREADRYTISEKDGVAGDVAARADPRDG